jgi:bacillithiol biosynthesis cysteine-adding enzyme BshC
MSEIAQFLPYGLADLPRLLEQPRAADRQALSTGLLAYLKRLGAPREALEAAERLAQPNSRAIVTGQQAGLLGGPSFTFYKAHTALALAKAHDHPDRPVLPVFWVASQDHDTDEIRSVQMLDFDEEVHTLSLELPRARPAGRIPFAPHLPVVCELLERFKGVASVRRRVCVALKGDWTYAEAFARLLLEFLGPEGLVPLDPMAPELAPVFSAALRRELDDPLASSQAINQAAEAMRAQGLHPVLGRGEGATNLFLEGEDGERRLLRYRDGRFDDGQRSYSRADLEALLEHDPSRLTPAAGLRPVVQDVVLPTAAFVVGPGEMKYVAELGGVYRLHGLEPPAVVRRLSAVVLEPPVRRILEKYGLEAWDFQDDPQARFLEVLAKDDARVAAIEQALNRIQAEFERLRPQLLEAPLQRPTHRAQVRISHELERLRRIVLQTELRREGIVRSQFERLKLHLTPGGLPQERVYPFVMYLLKHGEAPLSALKQAPSTGRLILEI